jgi:hypothetical protein
VDSNYSINCFGGLVFIQARYTKKNNEEILKQQREIGEDNIKADVVSKSRIEWIQKVREESANFISDCYKYVDYAITSDLAFRQLSPEELIRIPNNSAANANFVARAAVRVELIENPPTTSITESGEIPKEREIIRNQIYKTGNLLILYFGPDESKSNMKIVKQINDIFDLVKSDVVPGNLEETVKKFRNEIRIYLKAEWKRANGTIADEKVNEYLDELRKVIETEGH